MIQINRPTYLQFLTDWKDEHVIKVVSGVRRCGKSTLFEMFKNHLIEDGIDEKQIISINFENIDFDELRNPIALNTYIKERIKENVKYYLFLDEIQNVTEFERVVNSLQLNKNLDIYLTGSNAYFLSGELATLLTGRYVELKMLPLSFKEFLSVNKDENLQQAYNTYLKSSFPYAIMIDDIKKRHYLEGIYSTVVLKDIVKRLNVTDVSVLEQLIRYMYAEIGNLHSINKITNTLNSSGSKITNKTVANYMSGIEDSMLVYRANRFNVKGRKVFSSNSKYYAVDIGLRRLIAGDRTEDYGHILENIIYLELLRREYQVFVGVIDNLEVDFLAIGSGEERLYIQVAYSTEQENTLKRELRPLERIKDNYPKLLLTMDTVLPEQNFGGIRKLNALKWLANRIIE
ncbi:ATP-binding protein [Mesohalobacter halotolerans]|uniref:ATP-binding protein n=1 Tax=Mesohalobacter halotolerans TaxID=1883405 RepID=A0A4U5TRU8_9FLAO|nr:ATP-binding protein [Mesohalobacter halotolerans]TKS56997.1 ATP-binding protein [Mesohalobacter halotolerans]